MSTPDLIQTIAPLFNSSLLIGVMTFLLMQGRRATPASLSLRVEKLEDEQHMIRGNLTRMEHDLNAFVRGYGDANDHILRELDAIREMLDGKVSLRRQFEVMADDLSDLKGRVQVLRCLANPVDCADEKKG